MNEGVGEKTPKKGEVLIFVVDDEIMVAEVVEAVLSMQLYHVILFDNPKRALEAFIAADPKPDLLFTDYMMDEMSGLELIEQCKLLHPAVKTILYSGSVGQEIWETGATKPDDFISKPFHPRNLLDVVRSVLASRSRPVDPDQA